MGRGQTRDGSMKGKGNQDFQLSSEEEPQESSESEITDSDGEIGQLNQYVGNPDKIEKSEFHELDNTIVLIKKSNAK